LRGRTDSANMLLNLKWRWPPRYGYPPENQEGQQPDWGPTYVSASYQIRANGNDKAKQSRADPIRSEMEPQPQMESQIWRVEMEMEWSRVWPTQRLRCSRRHRLPEATLKPLRKDIWNFESMCFYNLSICMEVNIIINPIIRL